MKKLRQLLIGGGLLIATVLVNPMTFIPTANVPVEVQAAETPTVEPRADEIGWIYRELADGTVQKRRWNYTRGYWVDPDWITVS